MQLYIHTTIYPCGYAIALYYCACGGIGLHLLLFFLIDKMNTFLGWNACIYLGSIDNLFNIYCSIFNMRRIVLSKSCFRQSELSFLSLRVADVTQRKCFGKKEWSENTENKTLFLKTLLPFKKKYFLAILFSMDYKLWSHNILKGFLCSYLHGNLDFL